MVLVAVVWAAWPWTFGGGALVAHDTAFSSVLIDHLQRAITEGVPWWNAPLAWPLPGIAQGDWMGAEAVLALPLQLAGFDPTTQHAALVLAAMVLGGVAGAALARELLGPGPHVWTAAAAVAAGPYLVEHAGHANLVHLWPVLGGLALWLRGALRAELPPHPGRTVAAAGAMLGLAGHFGAYLGAFALVSLVVLVIARPRRSLPGLAAFAVVSLPLVVVAWTLVEASVTHQIHLRPGELEAQSAPLTALLAPNAHVPLHTLLPLPLRDRSATGPGYLVVGLAVLGLVYLVRRRRLDRRWRVALALGIVAGVLALGPWLRPLPIPAPYALLSITPGLSGLREPIRWLALTFAVTGVLAAAGVAALAGRIGPVGAGLVGVLAVLAETPRADTGAWDALQPPAVYRLVRELDAPGALYDVGVGTSPQRLRAALTHGRSLVGGTYARSAPAQDELNRMALRWPAPPTDLVFRKIGVGVVLRPPGAPPPPDVACQAVAGLRLCVLPPSPRLPHPASIGLEGPTPVGVRATRRLPDQVTLRCGDEAQTTSSRAWHTLTALRGFPAGLDTVDVFWEGRCEGTLTGPGATIYASDARTWPVDPLPAEPRHPEVL